MKKITILLILALNQMGQAQVPVIDEAYSPKAGERYELFHLEGLLPDVGNAGANQTWDFSKLSLGNLKDTVSYHLPEDLNLNGLDYADLVQKSSLDSIWYKLIYLHQDSLSETSRGYLRNSMWNAEPYEDPKILMSYPFSYGDSLVDYSCNYWANTGSRSMSKVKADAYGQLKLHTGTYPVLRIHRIDSISESFCGGFWCYFRQVEKTTWTWYCPWFKEPIISICQSAATGYGSEQETYTHTKILNLYSANPITSTTEGHIQNTTHRVFPQPSSSFIVVEDYSGAAFLTDLNGGIISNINFNEGEPYDLNPLALPNGIYLLHIGSEATQNRETLKIIIQKE